MDSGAANEYLALQEIGIPLVQGTQSELTPFQKTSLLLAMQRRAEEMRADAGLDSGAGSGQTVNSRHTSYQDGRIVEKKKFINKSAETGRDPDDLIREHTTSE